MSNTDNKREQAEKLLRAIGEIDDRFLLEAMKQEQTADISGQAEKDRQARDKKKLRRYSTWALTAAACLTVVIIGRYVSVNSVRKGEEQVPVAVVEERQTGAVVPDEAMEEAAVPDEAMEDAAAVSDEAMDAAAAVSDEAMDAAAVSDEAMEEAAVPDEAMEDAAAKDGQRKAAADDGMEKMMENAAEPEQAEADGEAMEEAGEAAMDAAAAASGTQDTALEKNPDSPSAGMVQRASEAAGAGTAAALTIPNPFVDTKTLEEAEEEAGFSILLPEGTKPYDRQIYRAMKGQMIEVIYVDGDNREIYRIRKGKNLEDDISGIYFTHAVSDTLQSDSVEITVKGEEKDQWTAAVWTQEEDGTKFSYSICSGQDFMEKDEILKMAEEMMAQAITQPR